VYDPIFLKAWIYLDNVDGCPVLNCGEDPDKCRDTCKSSLSEIIKGCTYFLVTTPLINF
jgi:hypothetical protein